jgi:hypothetical protein
VALGIAALSPAGSSASITFGSDLKPAAAGFADDCILSTSPCTQVLTGVRRANAFPAASPTDGVVVSFGIKSSAADTVTFRLARLARSSERATGAGTGPERTLPGPGRYSFPARVPVRAGDFVGVDTSSVSAYSAAAACGTGARALTYHPTLADRGPFRPVDSNSTCELLVNAKVSPSNRFRFEGLDRNRGRGTAILAVSVPGPGGLALSGQGIKRTARHVAEAGGAKLRIAPKGKLKRRLARRGEAKAEVEVTFKPEGGRAATKSRQIRLIRR